MEIGLRSCRAASPGNCTKTTKPGILYKILSNKAAQFQDHLPNFTNEIPEPMTGVSAKALEKALTMALVMALVLATVLVMASAVASAMASMIALAMAWAIGFSMRFGN